MFTTHFGLVVTSIQYISLTIILVPFEVVAANTILNSQCLPHEIFNSRQPTHSRSLLPNITASFLSIPQRTLVFRPAENKYIASTNGVYVDGPIYSNTRAFYSAN